MHSFDVFIKIMCICSNFECWAQLRWKKKNAKLVEPHKTFSYRIFLYTFFFFVLLLLENQWYDENVRKYYPCNRRGHNLITITVKAKFCVLHFDNKWKQKTFSNENSLSFIPIFNKWNQLLLLFLILSKFIC